MFPKPQRLQNHVLLDQVRRQFCCICYKWPSDPSHIRSRGAGGPDTPWNVAPHCRQHHTEWHKMGWGLFCFKYPKFKQWLERNGWYFDGDKLRHAGLERGATVGQEPGEGLQIP